MQSLYKYTDPTVTPRINKVKLFFKVLTHQNVPQRVRNMRQRISTEQHTHIKVLTVLLCRLCLRRCGLHCFGRSHWHCTKPTCLPPALVLEVDLYVNTPVHYVPHVRHAAGPAHCHIMYSGNAAAPLHAAYRHTYQATWLSWLCNVFFCSRQKGERGAAVFASACLQSLKDFINMFDW